MNERSLRKIIREEISRALVDAGNVDSHAKFRSLVEAKLGRRFEDTDEGWNETYSAWSDVLQESLVGEKIEQETLDYYVDRAATLIDG